MRTVKIRDNLETITMLINYSANMEKLSDPIHMHSIILIYKENYIILKMVILIQKTTTRKYGNIRKKSVRNPLHLSAAKNIFIMLTK